MTRYHVTPDGPKECRARIRCRMGGAKHFDSLREAQAGFERGQDTFGTRVSRRTAGSSTPTSSFTMELSPTAQRLTRIFSDAGFTPYVVGGSVRDAMLGVLSKDVDIEIHGDKDGKTIDLKDLSRLLRKDGYFYVDQVGASFSVLKVRHGKEEFDVSLPRTEQTTGDGHRNYDIEHDSTMGFDEASSRRDFTINAMGYDTSTGRLVDPHGGARDLRNKTLRHVGPAFADDPLRAMRAVSFSSRFGFTLAPDTIDLCRELSSSAKSLSRERIEEEFAKVFTKGKHCDKGLETLHDIGWHAELKGFRNCSRKELSDIGATMNTLPPGRLRKAYLHHKLNSSGKGDCMDIIESSSRERAFIHSFEDVVDASKTGDRGELTSALRKYSKNGSTVPVDLALPALKASGADTQRIVSTPPPRDPVLTGKKLIERGIKPGPEMGKILSKAQRIQDHEGVMNEEELLRRSALSKRGNS